MTSTSYLINQPPVRGEVDESTAWQAWQRDATMPLVSKMPRVPSQHAPVLHSAAKMSKATCASTQRQERERGRERERERETNCRDALVARHVARDEKLLVLRQIFLGLYVGRGDAGYSQHQHQHSYSKQQHCAPARSSTHEHLLLAVSTSIFTPLHMQFSFPVRAHA